MKTLFVLFLTLSLAACSNLDKLDLGTAETFSLKGEILESDSETFIPNSSSLSLLDEKVYIYNPIGDYGFVVYDVQNQKYDYFGKKGNGPSEGILFSPIITSKGNSVCCFDIRKNSFLHYNISDTKKIAYSEVKAKRPDKGLITQAFQLNDSIYLATGAFNTGTCAFIKDGELLKEFLEPYTGLGDFMNRAIKDADLFMLSNDKKYLLRITQNGGFIGLYQLDVEKNDITPSFEKRYFPIECRLEDGGLAFTSSSRYGYISACLTSKYIYALYSGKKILERGFKGEQIHVYTYDGELKYNLEVDALLSGITVDNKDFKLYGLTAEGEKELCVYTLPNIIR